MNALIHRDDIVPGTEVHMELFDDRLEITSSGGMLIGQGRKIWADFVQQVGKSKECSKMASQERERGDVPRRSLDPSL